MFLFELSLDIVVVAVVLLLQEDVEDAGDILAVLLSENAGDGFECSECGEGEDTAVGTIGTFSRSLDGKGLLSRDCLDELKVESSFLTDWPSSYGN